MHFTTRILRSNHSGLTTEEREIIEQGFRGGALKILTATATLASGINLPARRVIFRTPYVGRSFIDVQNYRQMSGRAGRKGKDPFGESFLICKDKDVKRVKYVLFMIIRSLVVSELDPITCCLSDERRGLKRVLMEVIAAGVATTRNAVGDFCASTMLAVEMYLVIWLTLG